MSFQNHFPVADVHHAVESAMANLLPQLASYIQAVCSDVVGQSGAFRFKALLCLQAQQLEMQQLNMQLSHACSTVSSLHCFTSSLQDRCWQQEQTIVQLQEELAKMRACVPEKDVPSQFVTVGSNCDPVLVTDGENSQEELVVSSVNVPELPHEKDRADAIGASTHDEAEELSVKTPGTEGTEITPVLDEQDSYDEDDVYSICADVSTQMKKLDDEDDDHDTISKDKVSVSEKDSDDSEKDSDDDDDDDDESLRREGDYVDEDEGNFYSQLDYLYRLAEEGPSALTPHMLHVLEMASAMDERLLDNT